MNIISSTSGPTIGGALTGSPIRDFISSELFTVQNPLPARVRMLTGTSSGTATPQGAQSATVASGGSGYKPYDVLTVSGGVFQPAAQFQVTGFSSGVVTAVTLYAAAYGSYVTTPSNPVTTTGGNGSGCMLNVTWEYLDAVVDTMTSADILTTTDVPPVVPLNGYATGPAVCTSSDTSVATIASPTGVVTPIAQGDCQITIAVPGFGGMERVVPISVVETASTTTFTFNSFLSGTLGAHLTAQVSALITGQTPPVLTSPPISGTIINIITGSDYTAVRNPSVYTGAIDLTAIPIGPYYGRQGTLVTPRDLICAGHFFGYNPLNAIGTPVFLLDNSSTLTVAAVAAASVISDPVGEGFDIMVLTLSADVPSGITLVTARQPWWYMLRTNDSGSGAFMLINGALVLATDWYGPGFGPVIADNLSQINAAIAANGSPYALSEVDLSAFTSY